MESQWGKCNSCKKQIAFGAEYFTCSVSTCNSKPYNYIFCSVPCFERHLPGARHKDAAAINQRAPLRGAAQVAIPQGGARRIVSAVSKSSGSSPPSNSLSASIPKEILIVVSKLKDYVKAKGEMNTSGDVSQVLSDIVRRECDRALENAKREGRKTLMARDFK